MKLISGAMTLLFLTGGCSYKDSYFGVKNQAIIVPREFDQTEAAIEKAEMSPGAKYCPDKIARAKKFARIGVELYWDERCLGCRDQESMVMLAEARKLAHEVETFLPTPPPPEAIAMVPRPIPVPPPEPTAMVGKPIPPPPPPPEPIAIVRRPIPPPPPPPPPPPEATAMVRKPIPARAKPILLAQKTTSEPKV
ncbi:MAG: hypothetical protein KAT27_06410, partial [Desulfobacterales bacterium]|nr:hypothetical protein [Desulfobacterales bacterium]